MESFKDRETRRYMRDNEMIGKHIEVKYGLLNLLCALHLHGANGD